MRLFWPPANSLPYQWIGPGGKEGRVWRLIKAGPLETSTKELKGIFSSLITKWALLKRQADGSPRSQVALCHFIALNTCLPLWGADANAFATSSRSSDRLADRRSEDQAMSCRCIGPDTGFSKRQQNINRLHGATW